MEAREQDEAIGAGPVELFGEMSKGRVERRQFDGDGNAETVRDFPHDFDRLTLHLRGAARHVAGGVIEVELETVRTGFLELSGIGRPSAGRDAVERRQNRYPHG